MTQLEDYVQQREKLNELIAASRAVLNSNASETDKRLAKRRITQYGNLRKELNEQIALLSPESVKKRKSTGRHNVHIHLDDTLDGTKPYQDRFAGVYSTADGHTRTRYSGGAFVDAVAEAADDEISQEMLQRRKWMKEAVSAMTARQAEVVDLHYNKGYSLRKIAEISGVRPQSISEINVAAMDIMGYWCKARAAVSECKWPNGTFDFELFFEKIPNAFPYRCKVVLLRLADAEDDGYPTIAAFCRDNYDISESKIRYALAQIKMYCKGYGIPMSGVPYLIRRAKDVPFDQSSFIRACYSFSKRGDKGYSSLENNTIPIVTGKSPYHEYGSFDNAVFERLAIMGFKEKTSDIDRWIEEAIPLLSDKNREMAFRVINDKRSTKEVGEAEGMDFTYVEKHVRYAINFVAQQVCLRYDAQRIFAKKEDAWPEFLRCWRIFTKKQAAIVQLLIAWPEIKRSEIVTKTKMGSRAVADGLSAIKAKCEWLGIPEHHVFPLVKTCSLRAVTCTDARYIAAHITHKRKRKSG